jgi:iron(III) transport system substrate-binding protein
VVIQLFAGCERPASPAKREVVLYSSVDDYLLREIIPVFEKQTGITVKLVGDTEATKTTGLVERLTAERDHPRADVWWSSEPFGTMRLADNGVLEPYTSVAEKDFAGGWPAEYRAKDKTWYGFALRGRVIAFNTKKLAKESAPQGLSELADRKWNGRIGMARPQFGTTRGQVGAMFAEAGPEAFRAWAQSLKANGVRLYDGNSSVVRAIANGEVDVGLTDTDDVYSAQSQRWPIEMVRSSGNTADSLAIPNTVARVRNGPNPAEAAALVDFILSETVERMLVESDSRNTPVHPKLAAEFKDPQPAGGTAPSFDAIRRAIPEALKIWDEVFGS